MTTLTLRDLGFVGGLGALWTPARITTALWLDAADASTITLNGSTVSQWSDKSGNALNATQATAANQPTYTASGLNGRPVLTWVTANTSVLNTALTLNHPVSIYSVAQLSGFTTTVKAIVGSGNVSYALGVLTASPASSAYALWNPLLNGGAYINNSATTNPNIVGSTTVSNDENTWNIYVNGSNAGQAIWDTGTPVAPLSIRIGYSGVGNEYWLGTIAEVVICPTTLLATDRQRI